jgi:hypothetical protein
VGVDVIAASAGEVALLMNNVPVASLSNAGIISDILQTVKRVAQVDSGLGSGCQAALQLSSRRSGVGLGRRIFVLTDGIVSSPAEVMAFRSALVDCEENGIDILGIGLGIAPLHLSELFPLCLYAPNPSDLGVAMAAAMGVSLKASSTAIGSRQLYHNPDETKMAQIRDRLCLGGPRFCPQLGKSIRELGISEDFLRRFGDMKTLLMEGENRSLTSNPQTEPYSDGAFKGFTILIVILHLDETCLRANFDLNCGTVLKRKGFDSTVVHSYGEAIEQLTRNEGSRCPYIELWLIPSRGADILPAQALDKDTRKLDPFMRAVRDFWMIGGGVFLFPDNTPFTFQVNHLLANYLTFTHEGRTGRTNVRFEGCYYGDQQIAVATNESPACGHFLPTVKLPPPGRNPSRLSLRPGLVTFYEGNTISSAVNPSNQPISSPADLWPFTAFAWTSESVSPPRPFVLLYDPKVTSETLECPGPIVIHGGFTSAFRQFGDPNSLYGGTGRLIISIACWLTRFEERSLRERTSGQTMKSVPRLTGNYAV